MAGLSQGETLSRICQALGQLVNSQTAASAILVREGDLLSVRCHFGFGPEGVESQEWPYEQSFAKLVIDRNQVGYIEDIGLRPDLTLPQPKKGPRMNSALGLPLRVRGRPIGTLECYSTEKQPWSQEQIALVESLAAQASISLESADLFDEIDQQRRQV